MSAPSSVPGAGHAPRPEHGAPARSLILLALVAVWVIWGSTYLAIKLAITSLPPFAMAGWRFLAAGLLLFAWLRLRGAPPPSRAHWRSALVIGALMLAVANGAVVWAQGRIPSSLAALGVATTPLWVALLSGLLEGWPRALEWTGLVIGFFGVFLLNYDGDLRASPSAAGALLLAQLSWAAGVHLNRRLDLPPGAMASATQMVVGGATLLLASVVLGESLPAAATGTALAALAYLIVFGSIVAFSAFNWLIRNVPPSLATSNAYVNPLIAVLLGVGFADEHLGRVTLLAMVVILGGVAIVLLAHERGRGAPSGV